MKIKDSLARQCLHTHRNKKARPHVKVRKPRTYPVKKTRRNDETKTPSEQHKGAGQWRTECLVLVLASNFQLLTKSVCKLKPPRTNTLSQLISFLSTHINGGTTVATLPKAATQQCQECSSQRTSTSSHTSFQSLCRRSSTHDNSNHNCYSSKTPFNGRIHGVHHYHHHHHPPKNVQ